MGKTRAAAALMCLLLLLSLLSGCKTEGGPKNAALTLPKYQRETVEYTLPEEQRVPYGEGLEPYLRTMIPALLSDAGDGNTAASPLNIYMALAMLAEITEGDSRAQLESLLGAETEQLRDWASALWQNNYRQGDENQVLMGGALWLDDTVDFKKETLDLLAERYYAGSYRGKMGSGDFNAAFQNWLNDHTGGLLADQIGGLTLPKETVLALSTTVYFTGWWDREFSPDKTVEQTFYAPDGEIKVQMMKMTDDLRYYWGDDFSAVCLRMDTGRMWFILPDEGKTPADLLKGEQALDLILNGNRWENDRVAQVHLSIPKFDVSAQKDVAETLKTLGVQAVFDPAQADFSPVTDTKPVWASSVLHGARVKIDEQGCEAASYTLVPEPGAAPPPDEELEFTLDRPFLFCVDGPDGLPLFVGIVNQP